MLEYIIVKNVKAACVRITGHTRKDKEVVYETNHQS